MERSFLLMRFLLLLALILSCQSCIKNTEDDKDINSGQGGNSELTQVMNLLSNGTCDKWISFPLGDKQGEYMSGWSLKDNHGSVFCEKEIVYEGKYAAKLSSPQSGITAFISQKVPVSPGHHIRIAFHYRMDYAEGNGARMYCYIGESGSSTISNSVLHTFYDDATMGIIRGGGYGTDGFSDTEGRWQMFDHVFQIPAIARYFTFEIHAYAGTDFYVDDCYIIDTNM